MGFIDGDGFFGLEKMQRKRYGQIDVFYRPILAISQNDMQVLYKIKTYIGCGTVSKKGKNKNQYHYRIRSAKQLKTFFVPLVQHRSFQTNKQLQYKLLQKAVVFLTTDYNPKNQQHNQYLEQIDRDLRQAKTVFYNRFYSISSEWFIGFLEAEGTLFFDVNSKRFLVKVTQKNKPLLIKIQTFLGYGKIHKERDTIYYFGCYTHVDLQKIFLFLKKYPFYSQKNISRIKWLKAYRSVFKDQKS